MLSKTLCCLGSRPVVNLFNNDDDDGDDGDIFKQLSAHAAAEKPTSPAAKHKVLSLTTQVVFKFH